MWCNNQKNTQTHLWKWFIFSCWRRQCYENPLVWEIKMPSLKPEQKKNPLISLCCYQKEQSISSPSLVFLTVYFLSVALKKIIFALTKFGEMRVQNKIKQRGWLLFIEFSRNRPYQLNFLVPPNRIWCSKLIDSNIFI